MQGTLWALGRAPAQRIALASGTARAGWYSSSEPLVP